MTVVDHESQAGAACTDDGCGMCTECGVALTTCTVCGGIGYHRDLCPESDETIALHMVRDDLAAVLRRRDLPSYADAMCTCEMDLLSAVRELGLAGRDSLANSELTTLLNTSTPVLRSIAGQRTEFGP